MVRSIFFGDSLAFSLPLRGQPGQPHHGRAHPGPLGGYRLLLEWVFFRPILILLSPLCFCIFLQGRRPPVWNFTLPLCSKRNCTQPQVVCTGGRAGSHTNLASSSLQFVFFFPSRRVARARLGTHSCAAPREKEECTVDRVCHVSLRAGMCLPDKLSNVTLSMSPTQKGERQHETRARRTILTSRNTDTSGNSHIHIHTYTHTLIHSYTHTLIHTYTHTHINTSTHTHTHTNAHTNTHTRPHARTPAHTRTHTHTHTPPTSSPPPTTETLRERVKESQRRHHVSSCIRCESHQERWWKSRSAFSR